MKGRWKVVQEVKSKSSAVAVPWGSCLHSAGWVTRFRICHLPSCCWHRFQLYVWVHLSFLSSWENLSNLLLCCHYAFRQTFWNKTEKKSKMPNEMLLASQLPSPLELVSLPGSGRYCVEGWQERREGKGEVKRSGIKCAGNRNKFKNTNFMTQTTLKSIKGAGCFLPIWRKLGRLQSKSYLSF